METPDGQVILEEEIDEDYEPTEQEMLEYAQWLGMDIAKDKDLVWVAREGLKAPLPENWKPCKTPQGDIYYFNFTNGESIWDHPCDEFYKNLYKQEKEKRDKQRQDTRAKPAPASSPKTPAAGVAHVGGVHASANSASKPQAALPAAQLRGLQPVRPVLKDLLSQPMSPRDSLAAPLGAPLSSPVKDIPGGALSQGALKPLPLAAVKRDVPPLGAPNPQPWRQEEERSDQEMRKAFRAQLTEDRRRWQERLAAEAEAAQEGLRAQSEAALKALEQELEAVELREKRQIQESVEEELEEFRAQLQGRERREREDLQAATEQRLSSLHSAAQARLRQEEAALQAQLDEELGQQQHRLAQLEEQLRQAELQHRHNMAELEEQHRAQVSEAQARLAAAMMSDEEVAARRAAARALVEAECRAAAEAERDALRQAAEERMRQQIEVEMEDLRARQREAAMAEVAASMDSVRAERQRQLAELEAQAVDKKKELAGVTGELAARRDQLSRVGTELSSTSTALAEASAALEERRQRLEALDGDLLHRSLEFDDVAGEVAARRRQLAAADAELASKRARLQEVEVRLTSKMQELSEVGSSLAAERLQLAEEEGRLSTARQELAEAVASHARRVRECEGTDAELGRKQRELVDVVAELGRRREEAAAACSAVAVSNAERRLEEAMQKLEEADAERQAVFATTEQSRQELQRLQQHSAAQHAAADAAQHEAAGISSAVVTARNRLAQLEAEVDAAQRQLEALQACRHDYTGMQAGLAAEEAQMTAAARHSMQVRVAEQVEVEGVEMLARGRAKMQAAVDEQLHLDASARGAHSPLPQRHSDSMQPESQAAPLPEASLQLRYHPASPPQASTIPQSQQPSAAHRSPRVTRDLHRHPDHADQERKQPLARRHHSRIRSAAPRSKRPTSASQQQQQQAPQRQPPPEQRPEQLHALLQRAREFLRQQRRFVKERQAMVGEACEEWRNAVLALGAEPNSGRKATQATLLTQVKASLEEQVERLNVDARQLKALKERVRIWEAGQQASGSAPDLVLPSRDDSVVAGQGQLRASLDKISAALEEAIRVMSCTSQGTVSSCLDAPKQAHRSSKAHAPHEAWGAPAWPPDSHEEGSIHDAMIRIQAVRARVESAAAAPVDRAGSVDVSALQFLTRWQDERDMATSLLSQHSNWLRGFREEVNKVCAGGYSRATSVSGGRGLVEHLPGSFTGSLKTNSITSWQDFGGNLGHAAFARY